jgi:endonuclease/exonuclease/phosphatase family metal-dependent hydrolase
MAAVLAALFLARRPTDFEPFRFAVYFGPRGLFALPFVALLPWTAILRQRWLAAECVLGLLLVAGPLMDVHWGGLTSDRSSAPVREGESVRLMTYNIGKDPFDFHVLIRYLEEQEIDVLLVQEDSQIVHFTQAMVEGKGWKANSQRTIFSRWPIVSESLDLPHEAGGDHMYQSEVHFARIRKRNSEFLVGSAHAPSVRSNFYRFLDRFDASPLRRMMTWQQRQLERIAMSMEQSGPLPLVLGGDFNSPPRSSLARSLEKRYTDVFAQIGFGFGYTYPTQWPWLRLDRFYVTSGWTPRRCFVAPDFGSDHRPLFVELILHSPAAKTPEMTTGTPAISDADLLRKPVRNGPHPPQTRIAQSASS